MRNSLVIDEYGNKAWYKDDKIHRDDDPTYESYNGDKWWYKEGKRHRLDGPAIEYSDGNKYWYKEGKLHRIDGPAIEYSNGTKEWYKEGNRHRLDGSAFECANGYKEWWYEGEEINCKSQEEFERIIKDRCKIKNGLVIDEYGNKAWYKDDVLHCVEFSEGSNFHLKDGKYQIKTY